MPKTGIAIPIRDERVVAFLALTSALLAFVLFRGLRQDDAYITFQFAKNLGSARGFVFNPGQRIFGSTSPLDVLILGAVYAVAGDVLAPAAIFIGAMAVAAQALLMFALFRQTSRFLAWLFSALTAAGFMDSYSWLPLETNLLGALILAVIWVLQKRREVLCGVLLGFAFLCRYDAVLLVPICVVVWWQADHVLPRRMLIAALLVVSPWLGWAFFYFGSILPETFYAKEHITPATFYLPHVVGHLARSPWAILPAAPQWWLVRATPVLWASGVAFVWRHARQALGFVAYGGALLLAYSWIGPDTLQYWHLYPTQMALNVLLVLGSVGWLTILFHVPCTPVTLLRVLPAGTVSVVLLLLAARQTAAFSQSYPTDRWLGWRHGRYVDVANWLRSEVRPDSVVMANEVGTLGYLSGLRMVDPYGLINLTNEYPRDPEVEYFAELIDWYHPNVLLVDSPTQGAWFERRSSFRMVKVFGADPWSTLLVRAPDVLANPQEEAPLRAQLPDRAHAAIDEAAR